ncbi:TonB-dependent receptor [candidate division KSB1 bacterium]|nr:TonB-dependent receptor [candidate division KSB1 bacterium]
MMKQVIFYLLFPFTALLLSQPLQQSQPPLQVLDDSLATASLQGGFYSRSDSALITGSDYYSFADVFDALPFATSLRRNPAGQPLMAWIFAGPEGDFTLDYNGLVLDNPISNGVVLRMIPTESIAGCTIVLDPDKRRLGVYGSGRTLQLFSRDLASLPIRSRVTYRTGMYGYDDIDARLGILPHPRVALNAGGLAKTYLGAEENEKYSVQKIDFALEYIFRRKWSVRYRLLKYKSDLDLLLPALPLPSTQVTPLVPQLQQPHEKIERYDHGFFVQRDSSFYGVVQLTDHHRELYAKNRSFFDQSIDLSRLRAAFECKHSISKLDMRLGAQGISDDLNDNHRNPENAYRLDSWVGVGLPLSGRIKAYLDLNLRKAKHHDPVWLPRFSLTYRYHRQNQLVLWLNREWSLPAYSARYSDGPWVLGNPDLKPARYTQTGAALRFGQGRLSVVAGAGALLMDNYHTTALVNDQPRYIDGGNDRRAFFDLSAALTLSRKFTFFVQGRQCILTHDKNDQPLAAIPVQISNFYLRFFDIFFKKDLHVDLRIGCNFWGERYGMVPFGVRRGGTLYRLDAALVPYAHAKCIIKDATLFLTIDNPLGVDYAVIHGFPGVQRLIRYGFSWNFLN